MSRRIYRPNDRYTDRNGRTLFRCQNVHSIDRGVFVTFSLPLDISPESATLEDLVTNVGERVRTVVQSVLSGLRNRDNLYIVAVYQTGISHNHVHLYIDQSRQMINTNGHYFDLFARNTDDPVLKSVKGLMRYLFKAGTVVVYTYNDTLLDQDDETDGPTCIATRAGGPSKGKENIRQVVKRIMDGNPKMDLRTLNQYCLTLHFSMFDQNKVQTAFQNWVSKHMYDLQKEDITGQDPFVTLAVLIWIAYQKSTKILPNVQQEKLTTSFLLITTYTIFTKICNRTRKPQDNCLWMTGCPGIGKSNSWQWINFALDPFIFNPGAQGIGKYDGAEAKKIAVSDQ